jgi:hypothetical protein
MNTTRRSFVSSATAAVAAIGAATGSLAPTAAQAPGMR